MQFPVSPFFPHGAASLPVVIYCLLLPFLSFFLPFPGNEAYNKLGFCPSHFPDEGFSDESGTKRVRRSSV
jgi:hypothetical protein